MASASDWPRVGSEVMIDVVVGQDAPAESPELPPDLKDPALYENSELALLDFNERVLQIAQDVDPPLLERVKFCAIWSSNLDEFFMVRVAGLHDQVDAGINVPKQDGLTPAETIARIHDVVAAQQARVSSAWGDALRPALAEHEVRIVD